MIFRFCHMPINFAILYKIESLREVRQFDFRVASMKVIVLLYTCAITAGCIRAAIITESEFKNAVTANGNPGATTAQYNSFVNNIHKGSISKKEEAAMALAQFIHESDRLLAKREYACVTDGCPGKYETANCDAQGQRYYGRGYIQITWCSNYRPASEFLYGSDILVQDPDLVARDENVAWDTAFWYWKTNVHSSAGVSEGKFGVTTRAINGGECSNPALHPRAKNRYEIYKKVRQTFGLVGDGDETGCYN